MKYLFRIRSFVDWKLEVFCVEKKDNYIVLSLSRISNNVVTDIFFVKTLLIEEGTKEFHPSTRILKAIRHELAKLRKRRYLQIIRHFSITTQYIRSIKNTKFNHVKLFNSVKSDSENIFPSTKFLLLLHY